MKNIVSCILFIFQLPLAVYAQKDFVAYQCFSHLELALSTRGGQAAVALSGAKLYGLGQKKRFKAGFGLRFTSYFGNNQDFVTAPARLTSGKTGPTVIFTEDIPANFDTLFLSNSQINFLNAAIFLQYSILPHLDVGFNIDAIGFSIGQEQTGTFMALQSDEASLHNTRQSARPTSFNLLLSSDNDIGSLNSEFFLRYWIKPAWGIKIGYTFLFAEYTTSRELTYTNDRFRNKAGMFMLGFTYAPFKK
ncbi:hypothetical protein GXP67_36530 [Rhodocytophaga rosea]|uniref:Outer membrane protein beta-barrel domain-containing protein n=1 Tax=Rhodocytophaga rosea TaxID=2704465 RepID=A0A6C0GW42_9BACT|nr:hypothetical protein [Rhodocytophaga rosea]QHT71783.1 hypothetical protein GXP67_36530 [Rhodocytophaga rosea]